MKRPGLIGTISLVASLALAVPMAIIGFEFLAQGRTVFGIGFLGLAVAMLFLPEYVARQLPRPRARVKERWRSFRGKDEP